jgi:phage repressor protein C with HTH and peptisase S24 domain
VRYGKSNAHFVDLGAQMLMQVPLVNQYAYAGYLTGYRDDDYMDELPKVPFIVDREYKGKYVCFEVRGDSMNDGSVDSYLPGDIALCREISPNHWKSKLHINKWDFIIVHKTEGILVKKIIGHDVEKGTLRLHSLNTLYEDFTINLKDVAQLFNVIKIERKK